MQALHHNVGKTTVRYKKCMNVLFCHDTNVLFCLFFINLEGKVKSLMHDVVFSAKEDQ